MLGQKDSAKRPMKQPPNNLLASDVDREACIKKARVMGRSRNSWDEGYASATTPSPLAIEAPLSVSVLNVQLCMHG